MTDRSDIIERQLQRLDRLAEAGLQIAVCIEQEARQDDADLDACAMAYSRAARAVRLTTMLQSRIIKDEIEEGRGQAAGLARCEPAYVHKARVERIVERVAKAEHRGDEDELDRLVAEAGERLDDEDLYGDVLDKPVGELVALICKDLGLEPDWDALGQEAWAKEEAQWPPPIASSPVHGGGGPEGRRGHSAAAYLEPP